MGGKSRSNLKKSLNKTRYDFSRSSSMIDRKEQAENGIRFVTDFVTPL